MTDDPALAHATVKPCRHGTFHYFAHDLFVGRSLDRYGEFSEHEVALFAQILKPGAVVVEAGANIGALTVPMARQVGPAGRIVAYEPQAVLAALLARNLADNGIANAEVRHAALGAQPGSAHVPQIDYGAVGNFGGVPLGDAGATVPLETIDGLALTRLDFVKIDVEGMETEVLAGAAATVRRHQPVLYVENDRKQHSHRLITALLDLDYRLWWHFAPLFHPDNFIGAAENLFPGIVSVNLLCLPNSRNTTVKGGVPVLGPDDDWQEATRRSGS
jgi:FkbM family methyltransferase